MGELWYELRMRVAKPTFSLISWYCFLNFVSQSPHVHTHTQ